MTDITLDTSPREMLAQVAKAREVVAGEAVTDKLIDQELEILHNVVVNLYLEKAHIYQLMLMTERDKPEGQRDRNILKRAVTGWRRTMKEIEEYVKFFRLSRWQSRIERYWGRLCDATGRYTEAISHYRKSIRSARLDPEFTDQGVPRWLEAEGFLAASYIYTGKIKTGWEKSKRIYKRFDTAEAADLKQKDYSTWAIWKSGVPIRIGQAMRNNKLLIDLIDLNEYKKWLDEAEKLLYPPPEVKVWVDFQFRKNEIAAIRRELMLPHP